jgi:hypothetical protein
MQNKTAGVYLPFSGSLCYKPRILKINSFEAIGLAILIRFSFQHYEKKNSEIVRTHFVVLCIVCPHCVVLCIACV